MQNTKPYKFDSLKWTLVVLILIAAIFVNYIFASLAVSLKIIYWIIVLLATVLIIALTAKGKDIIEFSKESRTELRKVEWPTRQETVQTTMIVVIMVTIVGLLLWGVDSGLLWTVGKVTQINR